MRLLAAAVGAALANGACIVERERAPRQPAAAVVRRQFAPGAVVAPPAR